ncbi:MAG: hypothetical protein LBM04_13785 [Opitutaceae bacterium]|jgi:hypothetical protein|nr:hypothetical protein [Opitutaceae bacterium]
MRPDEVPSQSATIYEGATKAAYVVGPDGRYTIVPNGGDEAEVAVTEEAVAWFGQMAEAARLRALAGETSPLEYHMYRQRMDVPTLAQATGFWRITVRRHLRPAVFAKLPRKKLERHAIAMGIADPEQLRSIPA